MPKENIQRAIDKSKITNIEDFESLRYEGFGPANVAVIVEALTDNKNRTASNIRKIFQKNGGSLGTTGSASHSFLQTGIIKVDKGEISDEKILDLAVEAGANDCYSLNGFHEIHTSKNNIYKVKQNLEKKIKNFLSTNIEWRPLNKLKLSQEFEDKIKVFIETLNDDDDVQNVYTNLSLEEN